MTDASSQADADVARSYSSAAAHSPWGTFATRLALSAAALLGLASFAFWPQYLSRLPAAHAVTHLHALFGAAWLLILIAQPLLIRARRVRLHRALGRAACVVGAAFVVSGVLLAHRAANAMSAQEFAREGFSLYLPFVMAFIFALAVILGVAWRRVAPVHARFMACSALPLLDPVIARILFSYFPPLPAAPLYQVPAFLLAGAVVFLLWRTLPAGLPGRTAFRNFGVVVTLALLAFFVTPYSESWLAFVQWFRSV